VDFLLGDPAKARAKLGWKHKIGFGQLVNDMVDSDLAQVKRESDLYGRSNKN
jgi:GDPmannose 4,6-dehydratase